MLGNSAATTVHYFPLPRERTRQYPEKAISKATISVVGLGYVGAVSCGCLTSLGHQVVGVDIDDRKLRLVGEGTAPIQEHGLTSLLGMAVNRDLLTTTDALEEAVRETDVTFVSVGTPTADDGGSDTRYIEQAALRIGSALRDKAGFHVVVLRCSVPPGTTRDVMVPIIERMSGKQAGTDFGVAFNPEFLREGVAVDDFFNPPKTVIGASDDRTADIVRSIFAPIDPNPIMTGIETAEMVKYVDNVWHATKVCFANEVGRLSKALDVDGRDVMDIFVKDTKLNLSSYYLRPGFAFGGSCLPKEVRAMEHLAEVHGVELPLIGGLRTSNAVQIDRTVQMALATGARRIAVLGLAFKDGTDDLRESPILEVMSRLSGHGIDLVAHDQIIAKGGNLSGQLSYLKQLGPDVAQLSEALPSMLRSNLEDALDGAEAVIVTHASPAYRDELSRRPDMPVIDVARLFPNRKSEGRYAGIGW